MRPVELRLEGFKSYLTPQSFNFDDRTLFGIVGPTGSGKSSILEGIIFALFGKTPRLERDTKKLINSQSDEAKVQLEFEIDDAVWEVSRVIRRKGSSQVVLNNVTGSAEQVTGDRAVNDRIIEVLGLDFAAFCSSVLLPQGEFDRFLKASPSDRSKILKGIFRLERVDMLREAAKARALAAHARLTTLQAVVGSLLGDETTLFELEAKLGDVQQRAADIREALPAVAEAESDAERITEHRAEIDARRVELEQIAHTIPAADMLRELADREDASHREHASAEKEHRRGESDLSNLEQGYAETTERLGGEQWLREVKQWLHDSKRLDAEKVELTHAKTDLETALVKHTAALAEATQQLEKAESSVKQAREQLFDVHRSHAADLLRAHLEPGQPCPVCEQAVQVVPQVQLSAPVKGAEAKVKEVERSETQARDALQKATREHDLQRERLAATERKLELLEGQLNDARTKLTGLVGADVEPEQEWQRREKELAEGARRILELRKSVEAAALRERSGSKALDAVRTERFRYTTQLSAICGRLAIEGVGPDEEAAGLAGAAKRAADAAATMLEELVKRADDLVERDRRNALILKEFSRKFEAGSKSASEVYAGAEREVASTQHAIESVRESIRRRAEAEGEIAEAAAVKARHDRLSLDLTDSKFTAYLLDSQRRLLSALGSEKLFELTGHFRFDDEGEFQIVDERTGMTRTPDTLSGGETFLASLSLALALAEAVALEGGRLGCFFLDEGFGSLDQESLELALDGITALAVPGRLIGLVSHVGGIQARLDDLIVLDRGPDGETVVTQTQGEMGYASPTI